MTVASAPSALDSVGVAKPLVMLMMALIFLIPAIVTAFVTSP